MPEGPSIVILKEVVQEFNGQKVLAVSGNSKIYIIRLQNQTVIGFRSWGKHFLICFMLTAHHFSAINMNELACYITTVFTG